VMATLNLRVLRPGSSPATDATLGDALAVWDAAESRLELELDARAVAYAVSRRGSLTLEQVYSLLWPRGRDARGAGLNAYSRYSELVRADRLILSTALEEQLPEIPLGPTTGPDAEASLRTTGLARIVAPTTSADALQGQVADLLTRSIDVGSVSGHARVVSAGRYAGSLTVTLELPEAAG
jgi:ATP-dependent Lhr-like helicase